jgi:hypothetical protein
MVNTFVTSQELKKSARNLDLQRLRKQCVEAYQILNILQQLHKISKELEWEKSKSVTKEETTYDIDRQVELYLKRVEWVKKTRRDYLKLDFRFIEGSNKLSKIKTEKLSTMFQLQSNDLYKIENDFVYLWVSKSNKSCLKKLDKLKLLSIDYIPYVDENGKTKRLRNREVYKIKLQHVLFPNDKVYKLGFSQHAVVKMWIGYETALKYYINVHIKEYLKRGKNYKMNLPRYEINKEKLVLPWWIKNTKLVIYSHRASLLRKENLRKEPEWYVKKNKFEKIDDIWKKYGYIWTGSLSKNKYVKYMFEDIQSNKLIPKLCAPIQK